MRSGIAIICIVAFAALQYGKLMSYWHCQLQASGKEPCDCAKILIPTHDDDQQPVMAAHIQKEKVEENRPEEKIVPVFTGFTKAICQQVIFHTTFIADGHSPAIDHPPRM